MSVLNDKRLTAFFSTMQAELSTVKDPNEYQGFAVERQQVRARKKAVYSDQTSLSDAAISRFLSVNEAVSKSVVSLDLDVYSDAKHFIRSVLENYTSLVRDYNIQYSLDRLHLFDLWGFGPGATLGTKATHPVEKMYGPWTCTSSALALVLQLRRSHPYLNLHDSRSGNIDVRLVPGSKLATVPKNEQRNRTIAIEPLGNMCLQLAAGKYIEGALRRIGLDIRDQQPRNKAAAREGSISGRLSTIDLQDASDMFKPELVKLLLPEEWYRLLMEIRSPSTILPDGREIQLNMISTMGNGYTFPLMTLILLALVYGTLCKLNRTRSLFINWNDVYVFGDDVIIPTDTFESVCRTIEQAGLIVNRDKSFSSGPFRESCGGDYYKGYDVTPFYVKSLESASDIYVALNQVLEWQAKNNCSLPNTLDLLFGYIEGSLLLVPEWANSDSGVKTSLVSGRYKSLMPKPARRKLVNNEFATPLVVGGYVMPHKLDLFYTPRQYKTRYVIKKLRLPRGYLSGRDPLTRSYPVSHSIDSELFVRGFASFGKN